MARCPSMQTVQASGPVLAPRVQPFIPIRLSKHGYTYHRNQARRTLLPRYSTTDGTNWMDMPESTPLPEDVIVFPRLKERDPYKLLGVDREASFEEIQEARNYLYNLHKDHAPSREAIELALDSILQESMKWRNKHGFRPPQRGRKHELRGDKRISLWQRLQQLKEAHVPLSTLVNEGIIYLVLACWAGWQSSVAEPTLPLGGALAYAVWKLYDKRTKRNPEGPFMGGNALWGALLTGLGAMVVGGSLIWVAVRSVPLSTFPADMPLGVPFAFLLVLFLGTVALYIR